MRDAEDTGQPTAVAPLAKSSLSDLTLGYEKLPTFHLVLDVSLMWRYQHNSNSTIRGVTLLGDGSQQTWTATQLSESYPVSVTDLGKHELPLAQPSESTVGPMPLPFCRTSTRRKQPQACMSLPCTGPSQTPQEALVPHGSKKPSLVCLTFQALLTLSVKQIRSTAKSRSPSSVRIALKRRPHLTQRSTTLLNSSLDSRPDP
jgi:hypothetical protein